MQRRKEKGVRGERNLLHILWSKGFACVRGPASGGGARKIFYPDLIAVRNGVVYIFEIKKRKTENSIYLGGKQVERFLDFYKRAKGVKPDERVYAFIAVKIHGKHWRFIPIEEVKKSRSEKSYKIDLKNTNKVLKLRDLLALSENYSKLM